jgi:DNA primase
MSVISATPLLALFRSQGHEFKKEGKSYKTSCPFHKDDTPSLSVEPDKGLWHCFGCGAGGDGITFLEKSLGLTFGQAADQWRDISGEEPSHRRRVSNGSHPDTDRSSSPSLYKEHLTMNRFAAAESLNGSTQPQTEHPPAAGTWPPAGLKSEDLALLRRLQDIYAKDLATSEKGRAYLKERGITDPETIRSFGLGYVSGKSLPQMTDSQTRRLQDLGVLNSKGNETFYNCIVCPVHDTEGNIITFWARSCRQQVDKSLRHRALPTQQNAPFAAVNWQTARGSRQVILVEGFLDALACYQAGLRNVIPLGAAHGKLGFAQYLHREGVEEVLLAMDPDEAGDEGAKALAEELEQRGIGSARVRLDMDPADFFLQGGTATAFRATPTETLGQRSDDSEFILDSHNLIYRVRALAGRQVEGKLKVQILVTDGERTHRDTLNLYTHKSRKTFANTCSSRFDLGADEIEKDLEAIIQGLEVRQRQKEEATNEDEPVALSPAEQEEAEKYLTEPGLVRRLQDDMDALGYVGEEEAKLLVYLIATSRKLPRPLSGIIGSGSGAGKSFLAELAEQLTPPEDVVLFSKLSPQALYYLPEDYLSNKLLVLEERAGGEGADYAIRTLQSKDCLTQIVTLKDTETGQMAAKRFTVRGPIAYLETTTQSYLNQENTSRCFEIPLDESTDQTRRIHQHQRRARSLWGLKRNIAKDVIRRRHHNLQRVLQPVRVVIPYAEHLTFPARYLRTRRDHERFLSLIEAVAFLHQFQRVLRTASHKGKEVKYIEATVEDYAVAYQLALRVLWVSLDELSRWGRELIESCRRQVEDGRAHQPDLKATDFHWTRRQLREYLGWPDKRLRACLDELVSLEYLQTLDGSKGKAFVYRLNPDFSHSPKALGLLTPEQLQAKLDRLAASPLDTEPI